MLLAGRVTLLKPGAELATIDQLLDLLAQIGAVAREVFQGCQGVVLRGSSSC
jgi:hypothetical protein